MARPISYSLEGGTKSSDNDTQLDFDRNAGTIASWYEGEATELQLDDDVYDRMSADIVVMRDLADGIDLGPMRIAEKNQIRDYEYTYQRAEEIEVPAGRFETVVYLRQRVGSSRSTLIWFATGHQFLPVRLEQLKRGKSQIVTVATNLQIDPI